MVDAKRCGACNWFRPHPPMFSGDTSRDEDEKTALGRGGMCQRRSPYHNGFPQVYSKQGCGDYMPIGDLPIGMPEGEGVLR